MSLVQQVCNRVNTFPWPPFSLQSFRTKFGYIETSWLNYVITFNIFFNWKPHKEKQKNKEDQFEFVSKTSGSPKRISCSICLWNKTGQTLQKHLASLFPHFKSHFKSHQLQLKLEINGQSTLTELSFPLYCSVTIKRLDWVQPQSLLCWKSAWSQWSMLIHIRRRDPRGRQIIQLWACVHQQQKQIFEILSAKYILLKIYILLKQTFQMRSVLLIWYKA